MIMLVLLIILQENPYDTDLEIYSSNITPGFYVQEEV